MYSLQKTILSTFLFIICYSSVAFEPDREYRLTILHTNDHHGNFMPNKKGEYGMPAHKTLIDQIRNEVSKNGGHVLLLSGGDINTGIPESDILDAEPDFKAMNIIGYDAMVLGNHEFDKPIDILKKQKTWANFPFLSANVYEPNSNKHLFLPYISKKFDDLRIALFGLTTEDTVLGNPRLSKTVVIKPAIDVAKQLVPKLRKKNDLVIAMTHIGFYAKGAHGLQSPGDVTLATQVPGIDVIVGAHSQLPLFKPEKVNNTLILQAHEWGKFVGRLDIKYKNGKITDSKYKLIPINLASYPNAPHIKPDQKLIDFLTPYQQKANTELDSGTIGIAKDDFSGNRKPTRSEQTALGQLLLKAQAFVTNADVSIIQSGGIRASLEKGDVTYRDILSIHPFGTAIVTVTLTGKELKKYLQQILQHNPGSGGYPQLFNLTFKKQKIYVKGKLIKDSQTYKISINSYIASGGDKYPILDKHHSYVNSGLNLAKALEMYIKNHSPLELDQYQPVVKNITPLN